MRGASCSPCQLAPLVSPLVVAEEEDDEGLQLPRVSDSPQRSLFTGPIKKTMDNEEIEPVNLNKTLSEDKDRLLGKKIAPNSGIIYQSLSRYIFYYLSLVRPNSNTKGPEPELVRRWISLVKKVWLVQRVIV